MLKKFTRKRLIILGLVALLIGFGIYKYQSSKNKVKYQTTETVMTQVKKTVSASGTVTSLHDANLALSGAGKITSLYVAEGEEVEKNKLLVQAESYSEYQTAQAAKDARDVAKKDLEIYIQNYSTNVSAVGGEDEYYLNITRLEELVSKAEASYQAQLGVLSNTALYSPFKGTVVDVFYRQGETAPIGQPILRVADLTTLVFEISLDQEDFGLVKPNQEVEIILDSYADSVFTGEVLSLPLYADSSTDEFVIKIKINNDADHPVLLGMTGDADIIIDSTQGEVQAVLFDSLYEDETGDFLWILDNETPIKEYVEVGLEGDLYTEIKTDLSDKQLVIPEEVEE